VRPLSLVFVYLDEFGHEGPYISRTHPKHKTSSVFGLGGFYLPFDGVRGFSTWFYKLKSNLLSFEIQRSSAAPYHWEKKGSALFTTTNVLKYRELRSSAFRIINKIGKCNGRVFYVGIEKKFPKKSDSSRMLYRSVLREAIKRLDQYCSENNCRFFMLLDERERSFRQEIVNEAAIRMYGPDRRTRLIEPPIQAESHLYC